MFEDTRERPVETSLFSVSSRYYSPELGRFIQPAAVSTLNPHSINGLNLYGYANNNPISIAYLSKGKYADIVCGNPNSQFIYGGFDYTNETKSLLNYTLYNASYRSGLFYKNISGTLFYTTSQLRFHWSQNEKGDKARYGLFGKFSVFNTTRSIGIGDEYGIGLKGVVDFGTANLFIGYEREGSKWFAGVKEGASLATARAGVVVDLGNHGIEFGVSASLLTTGEFQLGWGSNGFVFKLGTPGPGGVGIYIRIY